MIKPFNPFDHVTQYEREGVAFAFTASPFGAYSAALVDMIDVAASGRIDQQSSALQTIVKPLADTLKALDPESVAAVLSPLPADAPDAAKAERAQIIEAARLWFTEKLHAAVSFGQLAIHWQKDERVKL